MEKQIGVDARHLLEVAAENKHRGVRKFPDRLPKTAKFLVGVLRDLVADEEVIPVQQKRTLKNNYLNTNKKKTSLRR